MSRALIIGRFQPFHNGHLYLAKKALKENEEAVFVIGSAQYKNTKENPFSTEERIRMIEAALENYTNYSIVAVEDINDDSRYVKHVEALIPKCDAVYTANPHTRKLFSDAGYKIKEVKLFQDISASKIRGMMVKGQNWQRLVPAEVVDYIEEINGVERVKRIR